MPTISRFLSALLLGGAAALGAQRPTAIASLPTIRLRPGLVITRSVRIAPTTYRLGGPASLDSSVIVIRGDDITVDFRGATMEGLAPEANPDGASGVAIRIDGGRNVVVKNAHVRGYKVGLLARRTRGLSLVDNDFSYNWKPRLYSLIEHESLADWLSHHHNEKDEWLRFGAGAYLSDVQGGDLHGNRVEQGMEGLMLVRSDSLRIWNNVLSFNSGVGLGLYRSSDNVIMHNRIDFDVRGYSKFYRRGQDSAGLLMYEQSCRNVVAYNSVTHGGDGLFLWAGQQTMDTGLGGANDNLFYENDFSYAPTNGMEATFSRNAFVRNRIYGSDHGLWGGYSYDSKVIDNEFARNRIGIAIEHGQNDTIGGNRFGHDGTAIYLWANPVEPSDWGYPKHHDTRSIGYRIVDNALVGNNVGMRIYQTRESSLVGNVAVGVDTPFVMKDTASLRFEPNPNRALANPVDTVWPRRSVSEAAEKIAPKPIMDVAVAFGDPLDRRDRSAIVVDDWGPYDWRSPKLWPIDSSRSTPLSLAVLGPAGTWRIVSTRGAQLSKQRGRVGDTVVVTPVAGRAGDWDVTLEYRGAPTVSPRGTHRPAAAPYRFSFSRFEPASNWDIRFFAWSDSTDPRTKTAAFENVLKGAPITTVAAPRLDYMWYSPTVKGVPQEKFAVLATSRVMLPAGTYTMRTISDDAIRVWVDGKLVIDDWKNHESAIDTARVTGGAHDVRVEYYQLDGWTELRLDFVRGDEQAGGSPGPH
ncbi:MAG TPA: right-handed parallel beta-helix repeat-containing protein [Gemmatimonadaceae bacterium]